MATVPEFNPKDIWIIIASYNEAKKIRNTVQPLLDTGYNVIVVDDGSADDTGRALLGAPVHYLRHPVNLGQGAALQTGMAYARMNNAQVAVHFDADGQHNAGDIPVFAQQILEDRADIVLGSRFLRKEDTMAVPKSRRLVLKVAIWVNFVFTGLKLKDAHNGFRVLGPRALEKIDMHENRMAHATEILTLIRRAKLRYTELPTHIQYDEYSMAKGQSSLNAINILVDLMLRSLFR